MRARGATAALLCAVAGYLLTPTAYAQQPALVGDPHRGKEISYTCLGCHGLQGYKSGYRAHLTMHSQASELSEQDMADVAAFFAGKPLTPSGRTGLTVPQAAQLCVACHGADGVAVAPMYPSLAGQHEDYLVRALNEYRHGGRKNPVMTGFAKNLKDVDIAIIAAYFARQSPG